ncbi:peptidase M28, partial [Shewanella sp. 0m-11]
MRSIFSVCALSMLSACSQHPANVNNPADVTFDESRFRQDIKTLASDKFEGRAPTTKGEQLTLDYLSDAFAEM